MIYIYCGEDSVAARAAYTKQLEKYRKDSAEIVSLSGRSIVEVERGIANNLNLFASQTILCTENLEKAGFRKSTKAKTDETFEAIVSLAKNKSVIVLDFEDGKQARQLKLKDVATVFESKPTTGIFKLLEICHPGNKELFIQSLRAVSETQDEQFVFIMLARHIRLLVLLASGVSAAKLPPWQKYKLIDQAKKWQEKNLLAFYSGLIKIEMMIKTSSNPYGVSKSLEILACHYL